MARLFAFDPLELRELTLEPLAALAASDAARWRTACASLFGRPRKPADCKLREGRLSVWSFDGEAVLEPGVLPARQALGTALREFCIALARRQVMLGEPHPSITYPSLDDAALDSELADCDTWRYLLDAVFARGAMPADLWFLDGGDFVTTNWLGAKSMSHALRLEAEDQLLRRMQEQDARPAADVGRVFGLFSECVAQGWDLYVFEPGS
jgi:hypothetical protein